VVLLPTDPIREASVDPRRFFPSVAIGGALTGFLLALPILGDILRCAVCVGVMAGSVLSMKLWLDSHRAEKLTPLDAAMLGGCSGGVAGVAAWVISVPVRLVFGAQLVDFFMAREFLPTFAKYNIRSLYTDDFTSIVMSLPLEVVLYAMMGALGGFLGIQYVFPHKREPS
jgi:hypothetical protein